MSDCPRCKLPMSSEEYESEKVLFCNNCWGHWIPPAAFERIVATEVYQFSTDEKHSVIKRWSAATSSMMRTAANIGCPDCGSLMNQAPFATGCGVVVDRCPDHGVWLDGGEIKRVQIFIDEKKGK